jgi:hypothetical protein
MQEIMGLVFGMLTLAGLMLGMYIGITQESPFFMFAIPAVGATLALVACTAAMKLFERK